jgi:hypothetical protein
MVKFDWLVKNGQKYLCAVDDARVEAGRDQEGAVARHALRPVK